MYAFSYKNTKVVLAKAFNTMDIKPLVEASCQGNFSRCLVIDHPPTPVLEQLLVELSEKHTEVHYRDHHLSERVSYPELNGKIKSTIVTRQEHPSCSTLVDVGEFEKGVIVADNDMDGFLSAMKAMGLSYPKLDSDAGILDGPVSGMVQEHLSTLGFLFMKAWKGLPSFHDNKYEKAVDEVVTGYIEAVTTDDFSRLEKSSKEYDAKVENTFSVMNRSYIENGYRLLVVNTSDIFEPVNLAQMLDAGVPVSGRIVTTGPIAKIHGSQVSLARTKLGEKHIDFEQIATEAFGPKNNWGPETGIISNTPFLIHFSIEKWEIFKPFLTKAIAREE